MKQSLLPLLRCPRCGGGLSLHSSDPLGQPEVESGTLACGGCGAAYPIVRAVPRFVPVDNYAQSFGLQWNRFRQTQLDSYTGTTISRDRFLRQTGWSLDALRGARVLDVGCGAGRFSEIVLSAGAEVIALDYSGAVDGCWENFRGHPRLHVIQADVYALPLSPAQFDFVYCFGMLQHTPNPRNAFLCLLAALKPGSRLAVDLYPRTWSVPVHPRTWLRPLTTRLARTTLLTAVERAVPVLLPISRGVGGIPTVGRFLRRLVPVANYDGVYPLTERQLLEWAILDTFDWLSPVHDHPQTEHALRRWFQAAGLVEIEIVRFGLLVGRGRRAAEP